MVKICKWCGKEFEARHPKVGFCSDACRKEKKYYYKKFMDQYDGRNWENREELFRLWLKRNGYGKGTDVLHR